MVGKAIEFKNGKDQILRGFIHIPKNKKKPDAIITLHGFPGSCDGKRLRTTASKLQKLGYLVLRFDFSGTDSSDGKFEDKLISNEVSDIKYAIDFLKNNYSIGKLILYGHSTGATDASLYAYKDKRINKLILSGVVFDLKKSVHYDFSDEQVRDFWTKGYATYPWAHGWLVGKRIKKEYYDEFFKLDIPKSIKKYRRPLLIIHGDHDEHIKTEIAKELYETANKPKKLVIMKGADHKFSNRKHMTQFISQVDKFIKAKK